MMSDMISIDMIKADMIGIDMIKADMIDIDMIKADMIGTDTMCGDTIDIDMIDIDIIGTDIIGTDIIGTDTIGIDMIGIDIIGIDIIVIDIVEDDLIGIAIIKTERHMMMSDMIRMGIIKMEIIVIYFHNITIYFHFKKLFRGIRVFFDNALIFFKIFCKKSFFEHNRGNLIFLMQLDFLDTTVIKTLDFFQNQKNLTPIRTENFRFPLVLGSGNAIETGKILFRKNPALFASESDAPDKIGLAEIQEIVVISASGSKHAPVLIDLAHKHQKVAHLISSTPNSEASQKTDHSYIFPKISEPYTYNTSTYFGYIY